MPSSDRLENLVKQLEDASIQLAAEQRAPAVPQDVPQTVPSVPAEAPVEAPPAAVPDVGPPAAGPPDVALPDAAPVPPVPPVPPAMPPAPAAAPAPVSQVETAGVLESVRARIAEERDRLNQQWLTTLGRGTLAVWAVGYAVVVVSVLRTRLPDGSTPPAALALFWSATLLFGVIVVGAVTLRRSGGLRQFLIGPDGRFSTSQTQAAVWTLVLVFAVTFLLLQAVWTGADVSSRIGQLDDAYLLLLGFPFAALVAARGLTATKVEAQTLQKVPAGQAQVRDLFTDDDGRGALIDVQFLLFNLVAIVYFVARFATDYTSLPKLPSGLVALTGVSALAYASSKAVAANAPRITSVTLSGNASGEVRAGTLVDLRGANLVPAGAGEAENLANVRVRFGTVEVYAAAKDASGRDLVTSEQITLPVPAGVTGAVDVVVVTAAGAQSPPYRLLVAQDRPVVTGVDGVPLAVGGRLTMTGQGFVAVGGSGTASVLFGGIPVQALATTPVSLTVVVPPTVAGQVAVPVVVRAAGGPGLSDTLTLPVATTTVTLPDAGVRTG